jgi:hypothetical protein
MVEFAQSYDSEMVRNFNNFKAFVMFDYAYISPENFLASPPPFRQHFREKFVRPGQNPRKCWSKHDDTPPMLMASRRPCALRR